MKWEGRLEFYVDNEVLKTGIKGRHFRHMAMLRLGTAFQVCCDRKYSVVVLRHCQEQRGEEVPMGLERRKQE